MFSSLFAPKPGPKATMCNFIYLLHFWEKKTKNVICAIFDIITFKDKIIGIFYLKFRVKYFRSSVWYRYYMDTYYNQIFLGEF